MPAETPLFDTMPGVPSVALTLTQPWATLVAIGAKSIETRSWSTSHRGPVAIHAAKGFPREAIEQCFAEPFASVLRAAGIRTPGGLPRGAVVAAAELHDCYRFTSSSLADVQNDGPRVGYPHEWAFGDYTAGRYGFALSDVRRLATPIPARGMLSLWRLPDDVRAALALQLVEAAGVR